MDETREFIDDRRVYFRTKKRCFLVLAVLCVVLLVIVITLAVLYSQAANKSTSPSVEKPKRKYEICNNDFCFDLGKEIVHNMNQSADPCQDFYAYSCGGWRQRNPLRKGQEQTTVLNKLEMESFAILKKELEQSFLNYSTNVAVQKTVQFYKSCLNTTAIDSLGVKPVIDLIDKYGGWSIFNNTDHSVSIETRISRTVRELHVVSLINTGVTIDQYNSSSYILLLGPAALTFPHGIYLNKSFQGLLNKTIDYFTTLLGLNGTKQKQALMAIYDFEVKLAKLASGKTPEDDLREGVQKSIQEKRDIPDNRKKLKEFCYDKQACVFLKQSLQLIYGRTFTGEEWVLGNATYYKLLYKLSTSSAARNPQILADFVMWRVFFQYLTSATSLGNVISGTKSTYPRWYDCIDTMMKTFDMPLGLMYVNKMFDETSKKTVEEMTNDIRQSLINRIPQQTWMDSDTQRKAKEKALAIRIFIGYPSYIKDPKKLEDMYKTLNVTDEYFSNSVAVNGFTSMNNINNYGKLVDKNTWLEGKCPAKVNGFYTAQLNAITYLAGILQPPVYNRHYPSYMQYGAIGMIIGHELTHGFDSKGRKYDKNGNLDNWWSNSADKNFKEKASCFVDQYNKYEFHGKKVNGSFTINENIADNGGIKIAYNAYQRWASRNGTEKILPGLELTPDQLFFVGFAQEWCGVFTDKGAATQLMDNHSPGKYRIIGSLSNFEKFSKAFQCPVNSPMNPRKKCSVW